MGTKTTRELVQVPVRGNGASKSERQGTFTQAVAGAASAPAGRHCSSRTSRPVEKICFNKKNVSTETRPSVLSQELYFYRKQLYSLESALNELKTMIHHSCDELQGQRMAITVGGQGDNLGNPRISEDSLSSEKLRLPPHQHDRIQFDASQLSHDALASNLKWKTVEGQYSSTELASKWWKEQPVASPVTQLSNSPFYYCNTIMYYLFLLSGVYYLPQLPFFFRERGES
jgi:hypothetical protein